MAVAVLLAFILPPAYREMTQLIENLPGYIDRLMEIVSPYLGWVQEKMEDGYADQAKTVLKEKAGKILAATGGIAAGIASGGQAAINFLTTLVLTPLVAFFMMKEWKSITGWVESLYPKEHDAVIRDLLRQIDRKLSGFIRGQLTVAVVLGLLYA